MPRTEDLHDEDPVAGAPHLDLPIFSVNDLGLAAGSEIVEEARVACRDFGFLSIRVGAAQQAAIERTIEAMDGFFGGSDAGKQAYQEAGQGHGWTPTYAEPAYQPGTIASVESFDLDRRFVEAAAPTGWPPLPGFRSAAIDCWKDWHAIGRQVLELVARVAGMEPTFLQWACSSAELNTLRFLHYPQESADTADADVGIAAHTDFECITLLYQDSPGLEIRSPAGHWYEAPAAPGRLVVLLDDMLETWTNGRLVATGHRVRRTPARRHSIVLFIAANGGLDIAPLPQFLSSARPARYDATEQGRHIEEQMRRARALATSAT